MTDALSTFDFSKFNGSGLFLKFEAGKPITLRVLTVDPMVQTQEFKDENGEINLSTKFCFIVYNFTDEKAQILSASPAIANKIAKLHIDPEFGADIKKIDIRISPTGEKLTRRYDLQVLPKAKELTSAQIKEAREIDLEEHIKDGQRMSFYKEPTKEDLKAKREEEYSSNISEQLDSITDGEPINLDDIPFN